MAEAAALAAAFESVSVGLAHVGGGVYRGVAPAVTLAKGYVLNASVIVFAGSGDTVGRCRLTQSNPNLKRLELSS